MKNCFQLSCLAILIGLMSCSKERDYVCQNRHTITKDGKFEESYVINSLFRGTSSEKIEYELSGTGTMVWVESEYVWVEFPSGFGDWFLQEYDMKDEIQRTCPIQGK